MCSSPVIIPNNTKNFHRIFSPARFRVPCGHCYSCQRSRSLEWQVRAYYQYRDCISSGGSVYFYTLTFNNYHLPKFDGIKCFDWKVVDDFCKRLRQALAKRYGCTLKLLITSEYGELYKRPHHHCLFYLYGENLPTPQAFNVIVANCWSIFNPRHSSRYPIGFVKAGDNLGLVTSHEAVTYVCKYVCKDFAFRRNAFSIFIRLFRKYYKLLPSDFTLPPLHRLRSPHVAKELLSDEIYSIYNAFRLDFSHHAPFIKYSLGFGASSSDYLTPLLLQNMSILLPSKDTFVEVPLPRYLVRKLFFDRVLNPVSGKKDLYRLNDEGVKFFTERVFSTASDCLKSNDLLYQHALTYMLDDASLLPLFNDYSNYREFMPYYKMLFRWFLYDLTDQVDYTLDELKQRAYDIYSTRAYYDVIDSVKNYLLPHSFPRFCGDNLDRSLYNFEKLQTCLDYVSDYLSSLSDNERLEKEHVIRRLKQHQKLSSTPHFIRVYQSPSHIYKPLTLSSL